MVRVLVLVEGQTEERFVTDVLAPYFMLKKIFLIPKILTTKFVKNGPDFKGGVSNYRQIKKHLDNLLGDTEAYVTTLIDYYGLPADTPGMSDRPNGTPLDRVLHVESAIHTRFQSERRFLPFLMLHEFEALLFSDVSELAGVIPAREKIELLNAEMNGREPEAINDNPSTAPSKRILRILPGYQKTLHGPTAAKRIGLNVIRQKCHHFHGWIEKLEGLLNLSLIHI